LKKKISVERLLRWRLEKAKAEAPGPPRAARLLAMARPWWETSPERSQLAIQRLSAINIEQVDAVSKTSHSRRSHLVPTLILRTTEELEVLARILYVRVNNGRMQLYFRFEAASAQEDQEFEVTFVSESSQAPLFYTFAAKSLDNEYHLVAELSDDIAREWGGLRVADCMPFRLILRPHANPR
jgi:hypothetical protein